MAIDTKGEKREAGSFFGLAALGVSMTGLIMALMRPAKAAEEPQQVIIDGDVRQALAALLLLAEQINNSLSTANNYLQQILAALGGMVAPIITPFLKENETLTSGQNFPLCEITGQKGALVWAVIDVTDPDTRVIFTFDDLSWEFVYSTLFTEGIDRPLFPGVWLSKYNVGDSHYALIFSAGTPLGFTFKERMSIVVRFQGTGTATLTEGRGIFSTYA